MTKLTKEQVKGIVASFVKQKYPNTRHITFMNVEFKGHEYWVNTFFRINFSEAMCVFCRIEADTGHIIHHSFSVY